MPTRQPKTRGFGKNIVAPFNSFRKPWFRPIFLFLKCYLLFSYKYPHSISFAAMFDYLNLAIFSINNRYLYWHKCLRFGLILHNIYFIKSHASRLSTHAQKKRQIRWFFQEAQRYQVLHQLLWYRIIRQIETLSI